MEKRYRTDLTSAGYRVFDMAVLNYVKKNGEYFLAEEGRDVDDFVTRLEIQRTFCNNKNCKKEIIDRGVGKDYRPSCSARCAIITNKNK